MDIINQLKQYQEYIIIFFAIAIAGYIANNMYRKKQNLVQDLNQSMKIGVLSGIIAVTLKHYSSTPIEKNLDEPFSSS